MSIKCNTELGLERPTWHKSTIGRTIALAIAVARLNVRLSQKHNSVQPPSLEVRDEKRTKNRHSKEDLAREVCIASFYTASSCRHDAHETLLISTKIINFPNRQVFSL